MKKILPIVIYILIIVGAWWFWGREPYITMDHPSDPILTYHTPKWNGWDHRGLTWITNIPKEIKEEYPDAQGWWHVLCLTIPKKELPPLNFKNPEDTMREWEKYFKWVPLGYTDKKDGT